ncbi:MAG: hypothetical protein KGM96_07230 [Acidobacteriota bacterium]|nr:hypothetical protein [Acidobacteriota bacterium]
MTQSAPQTFAGIEPEQYAKLMEKARDAGIELTGNSGTASKHGVEVAWNYSPESRELSIQCVKAPFFMSAADIDARIRSLVEKAKA